MKVGVSGVGSMGQNHARVLAQMGVLGAVMDSEDDVAKKVGERHGVPWYTDMEHLLEDDLDAVTIATPAPTHAEVADRFIDAGIDILLEKPIAPVLEDAERLVGKAKESGITLAIGMIERHNPVVLSTKNLISDGDVGDVITLSSKRVSSFPARVSGMGVIHDLAIHDVDVMRFLLDEQPETVYTLGGPHSTYEDHANIMIHFPEDVTGVLEVNWLTPHKVRNLSLTCSNDYVEIDYIDQSLVVTSSRLIEYDSGNLFDIPLEHNIRKFSVKRQEPLKREMEDFIEAVQGKHPPLVTGEDGLKSMKVVDAAKRSLDQGKEVLL